MADCPIHPGFPSASSIPDHEWARIEDLAGLVDAELSAADVRLTMGGEPTFVGADDPDSPEWNNEALGAGKQAGALKLIWRLRQRFSPGALLHFGQGKWYPGEELPRWALSCCWRLDGIPLWRNLALIASPDESSDLSDSDALRFLETLCRRLRAEPANILAAFDPEVSAPPAGYVLCLRRRQYEGKLFWSSQLWFERPPMLTLSAGSSAIGFRIPVDAVPWVAPQLLERESDSAPFQDLAKLPSFADKHADLFAAPPFHDPLPPVTGNAANAEELVRPCLCVQVRSGRLHISLPYVASIADYIELVAAVEDTCERVRQPIWIEGYAPPADPRIRFFKLTPDPGVLEVNLPPAGSWQELVAINTLVREEAQAIGLTAEKFAHDGNRLATGGGNHIVLGGATCADSPVLRRPDLLRSLLSFWQNHPSLSYFFSGMFVGPTSQYPRVDEARNEALYELELAFRQLKDDPCPPSTVDGLFRDLLVDLTGNAHRAEFCIDKLFPPDNRGPRLGLLELRAFEMSPDLRANLVTLLLVRALVCAFWKQPYSEGLVLWGPDLHDRFMLPHFIKSDFAEVLAFLGRSGFSFDEAWFSFQTDFRFPVIGCISDGDVQLELRRALEPWNVLAGEASGTGTSRSVDSSFERIQVKLNGVGESECYAVTCNGRTVPLSSTGKQGESVAAVKFRARRLWSMLHPTIPVQTPLLFDLIDCRRNKTTGRCIYHAEPPDGRIYSSRPENASQAEQRRRECFQVVPCPGKPTYVPDTEFNPTFPMTLDLRMPVRREAPSEQTEAKR